MSIALKLEKPVSATPERLRTQAFRLGLVAPAHSLRDTLISRLHPYTKQVLDQLQDFVLYEWARLEKTAHDMDFSALAQHLQQKAKHVWPRAALGAPPIPDDWRNLRTKLDKTLGGSKRTDVPTLRRRATTILKEHLAYLPSLMPPPEMPLTQFFGGQAKVVNAGTLNALERKGKKQRPAAPKPSPSPPPPSENSPAGTQRTRPNGTPTSAEGHTRPAGAPPLRPSPLGDGNRLRFATEAEAATHLEAAKMMATMGRAAPAEPATQPAARKAPKGKRRQPCKSATPRRLTDEQEESIPVGLHKTGRGWGELPLQTALAARHLVGTCGISLVKLPAVLATTHVLLHHESLPEQALFGREYATCAVLKLKQFDTAVAAARFLANFKESGGRLGGNVAHDGSDRADAKIGTKAHVMQYQFDYWDMEYERATSYLIGARAAASGTSSGTARQMCDLLAKWKIVDVLDNRAASFNVAVSVEQKGMQRSCNSDNATAAENVKADMEQYLGYTLNQWGCFQHRVQLLGTNSLQALTGKFDDTFELSASVNTMMSKLKWLMDADLEEINVNWVADKLEQTHCVRMKAPMLGKWEYVSDPLHKINLYLASWRTFSRNQAHRLTSAGQRRPRRRCGSSWRTASTPPRSCSTFTSWSAGWSRTSRRSFNGPRLSRASARSRASDIVGRTCPSR